MKSSNDYFPHNTVELVQGGKDYFNLLIRLIDEAQHVIHLQTYIYDDDSTGKIVTEALIRATERGVKVFLLLDGYGSQSLKDNWVKKVKSAGIHFRFFQPAFKSKRFYLGRRLHHKVVVIDSSKCTVAGLNISDRYNDTPEAPAWLDWALYAEGSVAARLEEICASRLRLRKKRLALKSRKTKSSHHHSHEVKVRARVNDWVSGKRQIYRSYLQMLRSSKERVIIMSAYFLPGSRFRKSIEDAVRRGVKIKVVLTGNADVFMIKYAERYIYRWLFKNNIEVYEYKKSVLHGKISTCDGHWMTAGSFNINNLSAYASVELNLDVSNKAFAQSVEDRLEEIIKGDCIRITEGQFNKQFNFFSRIAHNAAYRLFRFAFFLSTKQGGDA